MQVDFSWWIGTNWLQLDGSQVIVLPCITAQSFFFLFSVIGNAMTRVRQPTRAQQPQNSTLSFFETTHSTHKKRLLLVTHLIVELFLCGIGNLLRKLCPASCGSEGGVSGCLLNMAGGLGGIVCSED